MSNIIISDTQIQGWIQSGIQEAVASVMHERYGHGENLRKAMTAAIVSSQQEIADAIRLLSRMLSSPAFTQRIESEIAVSLANQFHGSFNSESSAANLLSGKRSRR